MALAVIAVVALYRRARTDSDADVGQQVRDLLEQRGEPSARSLDDDRVEEAVTNACGIKTASEWAAEVQVGASINVGGDLVRQMVFVASYVDVGCPDQRPSLEQAARVLGVPVPPSPPASSG